MMIKDIQDYYQINDRLATSGQPTKKQFELIAKSGYQIVVNLAMSCSTNAIADEGAIVTDLGMVYMQIPVVWEQPKMKDVVIFLDFIDSFKDRQIWVHCAKNMRVSCFIYFWQKYGMNLPEAEARYPMNQIWQPTGVWQELIEQMEDTYAI